MPVRVRFAPSPTGSLHLGNALTAVANRRFADSHGGGLLLRIDDTDPARTVAGGEDAILEDLEWLGITWDDGPNAGYDSAAFKATLEEAARKPGKVVRNDGDVDAALAAAARRHQADYYIPHLAHATMEPPAATVRIAGGKCEVWGCFQSPRPRGTGWRSGSACPRTT